MTVCTNLCTYNPAHKRCDTKGRGLMMGLGKSDLMMLKIFSNLGGSMLTYLSEILQMTEENVKCAYKGVFLNS